MATRTQAPLEGMSECIHEQICQAAYEQQRERLQGLCQWLAPDAAQARQLAVGVFVDAWRQPGGGWPAVSGDRLAAGWAESLVARFRCVFHDDPPGAAAAGPQLVAARVASGAPTPPPLRAAVAGLPVAHRLLYLMHEVEGYSAATLAAWLDLPPARCARMIHQARLQLRRHLLAA